MKDVDLQRDLTFSTCVFGVAQSAVSVLYRFVNSTRAIPAIATRSGFGPTQRLVLLLVVETGGLYIQQLSSMLFPLLCRGRGCSHEKYDVSASSDNLETLKKLLDGLSRAKILVVISVPALARE